MKRNKAPGPDGTPVEILKERNEEAQKEILILINEWWINENMPTEMLRARVY